MERGSTSFGANPTDYTLFELGEFDDVKGRIQMYEVPVNLGLAAQYVRQDERQLGLTVVEGSVKEKAHA